MSAQTPRHPVKSSWLELARQQSRSLAQRRATTPPPWQWPSPSTERPARGARAIPAWGMAVSVAVVLLMASGTWAFVRTIRSKTAADRHPPANNLSAPSVRPASRAHPVKPAGGPRSASARATPLAAAAEVPRRESAPSPSPKEPSPVRIPKKARGATSTAAKEAAPTPKEPGVVSFDGADMPGGGELILVTPPTRMSPLWTVEDYKRRGPGR